jgi:alcohol dehydrogenase YqhD (iron-dependent ADH family)
MPAWMKWYHSRNPAQFERFAENVFGVATPEQSIAALEAWFNKIGTPTRLSQLGIKEADLSAIVENAHANTRTFGIADIYTMDVLTTILRSAL